jgi:hypothetical protein
LIAYTPSTFDPCSPTPFGVLLMSKTRLTSLPKRSSWRGAVWMTCPPGVTLAYGCMGLRGECWQTSIVRGGGVSVWLIGSDGIWCPLFRQRPCR